MSDNNLYFSTPGPITICAPHPIMCPLGEIIYAGTKWDSQATYAHAPSPDYFRPTPYYLLVYTLEGEADYRDSTGLKTILKKGLLVWAGPGVNQSYGPRPGKHWSEFFIWFSGPIFDCWKNQFFPDNKSMILSLEPVNYWLNCFRSIVEPPEKKTRESDVSRLCRFQQMLAEAIQQQNAKSIADDDVAWLNTACQYLKKGTLTSPSLEDIACSMNMSYSLFRQKFSSLAGKSPGRYRTDKIMSAACRLLTETDFFIAEISDQLGFNDQFHFSRRFKQTIGISPADFRRQVKE